MKHLTVLTLLTFMGLVAACGANPVPHSSKTDGATTTPYQAYSEAPEEAVLLVSLEDGSVIMQKITSSADICFKMNSASATTCLTQGAPVTNPQTNAIIGFEMIEEHIDLVAKSH